MNRRKATKALDHRAVRKLGDAYQLASLLNLPLHAFLTVAPYRDPDFSTRSIADYFGAFRNSVGVWVSRQGVRFTAIWVIENNIVNDDPHMHMLLHLPTELVDKYLAASKARGTFPGVIHLRPDNGVMQFHSSGYLGSTLNYLRKQMTPQAWWCLGKRVRRENGGIVVGKRWGTTNNINRAAQAAFGTRQYAERQNRN